MHLCRAAWQKLAPLASTRGTTSLLRNAPIRQMSSASVPGSSGSTLPYYLLTGAAIAGGGIYVYRTLTRDRARFHDRHAYIDSRQKADLIPLSKGDNSLNVEAVVISETTEEAVESVTVEAVAVAAEDVVEQESVPTEALEQAQSVVGEEDAPLPTEHESPASSEVTPVPEESTEAVTDASSDPVLEAQTEKIQEELASAAEDWSELSARKPEEALEEISQAKEETNENLESKEAAASS